MINMTQNYRELKDKEFISMFKIVVIVVTVFVLFVGCSSIPHRQFPNCSIFSKTSLCASEEPRKITIFFDGTGNTEKSNTNISKLHNLVTLQDMDVHQCPVNTQGIVPNNCTEKIRRNKHIYSLYVTGVGVDKKVSGNLFGNGIDERVKLAYHYIAKNYRQDKNDQIYLFGFSRGSYGARILAGLIYVAELPDFQSIQCEKRKLNSKECLKAEMKLIDDIYDKYHSKDYVSVKRSKIKNLNGYVPKSKDTRIAYMGIFDTVAALTYNPYKEWEISKLSNKYVDQICNIDKVSHAMSLDDNRKTTFPPLPMSVTQIASVCKGIDKNDSEKIEALIRSVLTEVWFSGAHSDVGGGYVKSDLSGVSLNWMIRQIKETPAIASLLPNDSEVYEDIFADSHIGEDSILKGRVYRNNNRRLSKIVEQYHGTLKKKPVIHSSVFKRRFYIPRQCREFDFTKSADSNKDACYSKNKKLTDNVYEKCFRQIKIIHPEHPEIPAEPLRAEFRLELLAGQECFDINEPELYRVIK